MNELQLHQYVIVIKLHASSIKNYVIYITCLITTMKHLYQNIFITIV
jgi:hypothetical protein